MESKAIKLCNCVEMPRIGFGPGSLGYVPNQTGKNVSVKPSILRRVWNKFIARPYERFVVSKQRHEEYLESIANGIRAGFRLIDYSTAYGNGGNIADAIERSGAERKDIFLTGRISNRAQYAGADVVRELIKRHLDEYRTDYVDVLMFHWPVTDHFEDTWRVICEAYEKGQARSIGVANCHPHHIEKLMKCGIKPMLNQFEVHPLFTQKDLIKFNQDLGIVVESYTPIARNDDRLMRLPRLKKIATDHGKTPVQVILRWHIQ